MATTTTATAPETTLPTRRRSLRLTAAPLRPAPLYTIVSLPHRGKGVIAVTSLPAHTTIISETPLLSSRISDPFSALYSSTPETRARFYALHNRHLLWTPERPDTRTEGVWESNCFEDERGGGAVFEAASRLNHDCWPNAKVVVYETNAGGGMCRCKVVVTRPVECGEELTVDYLEGAGGEVARRRLVLARRWGFWCACRRCTVEAREGERWRGREDTEKGWRDVKW